MPKFLNVSVQRYLRAKQNRSNAIGALLLTTLCFGLAGCSLDALREKLKVSTSDDKEAIGITAERLNELDQATYSYSDRFVTLIADAADRAAKANPTKESIKEALRLKLHNSSSAYAITTGPNPLGQLLDLATMVTLNKINMVDEGRAKKIFGDAHEIIERAFYAAHDDIWGVAKRFLKPNEIHTVQRLIKDWRKKHPDVTTLAYVRFDDFARANAGLKQSNPDIGGLFDEINKVNQTVESAQEFGERTFFYVQRMPRLLQWQTERTMQGVMENADLQKLQGSVNQMANAAQVFAQEVQKLKEREASIQKHLDTVSKIVDQVHLLMPNTQAIVKDSEKLMLATKDTSVALGETIKIADAVSAKYKSDKPEPIDAKPFEINDYKNTVVEFTKGVSEARHLLESVQMKGLGQRTTDIQNLVASEIDHLAWRIAQLALLVFGLVLAYRFFSARVVKT